MNDSLQALLQQTGAATPVFPPNSRYHSVALATHPRPDGRDLVYVRRRFVPPPERFALLLEHAVNQGERIDQIAAHHLGDPEQYWRICDANGALRPDELTETVGRRLRITLPDNLPGGTNA